MSVSLCMCVCEYMHVFPFFSPPFFASTLTFIFLQIGYSTFSSNPLSLLAPPLEENRTRTLSFLLVCCWFTHTHKATYFKHLYRSLSFRSSFLAPL